MSAREVTQRERLARARAALDALPGDLRDTLVLPGQLRSQGEGAGSVPGAARRGALPVADAVREVAPEGLPRGGVVTVTGSTSVLLALAGQASRDGEWVAWVGMPHVGVLAAVRHGIDLSRLVLVPHPGTHTPAVIAACVEGMGVVVAGPQLPLSAAQQRRLASRVKVRGTVLLSASPWPGARLEVEVTQMRWQGLGAGEGRLRERRMAVTVRERGHSDRHTVIALAGEVPAWSAEVVAVTPPQEVA